MRKTIVLVVGILLFVGLLYGIYSISAATSVEAKIIQYEAASVSRPRAKVVGKDKKNIGTIKVSDKRTAQFVIQNTGKEVLQLYNATTSCNCTFGKILTKNYESPTFGMHTAGNFVAEVAPGEKAMVNVTYKPYLMPVYGKVDRSAIIRTNDPLASEIMLTVEANVE